MTIAPDEKHECRSRTKEQVGDIPDFPAPALLLPISSNWKAQLCISTVKSGIGGGTLRIKRKTSREGLWKKEDILLVDEGLGHRLKLTIYKICKGDVDVEL